MSNFQRHPGEADLLRLVDGELTPAEAREIELHLEGCEECRMEVAELRDTAAECLEYRQDVLQAMLPEAPEPWPDLRVEFARIDRSLEASRWNWRPVLRWALPVAALLAAGVFYSLRETPSVQAASLLHRAEAAAAKRPAATLRHVRLRTRTFQITRVVGAPLNLPKEPAAPELQAMFQSAHWDWNDPLSAQAFANFRDSLKEKTDSVTETAGTWQIRTSTPEGELAAASLTLRAADLDPIEARLEFRNQEWVELSEAPEEPAGDGGSTAVPHAAPPSAAGRAAPDRPADATSPAVVPVSTVLQVLAALHGIGADLGDAVDVNPVDGRVVVSGDAGILPARQREIRTALEKFPNVTVQFPAPEPAPAPPAAAPPPDAATSPPGAAGDGIAARVERQLGGHPQFERFSSQMLDWSDAALERAYALRRLAERFPASAEASFSPADRRVLRQIAREHADALADLASKMTRTLDPVLAALGGKSAGTLATLGAWQPAAEDLLRTGQRVERQLSILLGAAPPDGAAFSASGLRADLGRLEADIAICQRLLAQE